MNFFQRIAAVWQKVSLIQRALLSAVVLTFILVGALLFHWAGRPDMRVLYQDISAEEASKITEKISEKGVAYELRNGGTAIYVPRESDYQLRLDMAKDGLPSGGQNGYKIFDREKIGVSPFVQGVNLKRALEDELAKSIQMIDGVGYARVHLVTSEQAIFTTNGSQTSASVVLKLKPGYRLALANVAAITHLISGSVEGLSPEHVTVIDSEGRLLSGDSSKGAASGASTVQDYRDRVEQELSRKAEEMLTMVLGPGRATVKVSAVVDMNSTSTVREIYDPTQKIPTKEEIKSGVETEAGTASGSAGNVIPGGKKTDETIVTEYVVGKMVEQRVDVPGDIKSLTVAAMVDLARTDANESTSGGQAMIMQVSEVEEVIRNALGLKSTDSLKVVNTKFYRAPQAVSEDGSPKWLWYISIARHASFGVMAICALLVLRIFGGARKKASASSAGVSLGQGGNAMGLLPGSTVSGEPLLLRQQLTEALTSNPEQVKQLFYTWLQED